MCTDQCLYVKEWTLNGMTEIIQISLNISICVLKINKSFFPFLVWNDIRVSKW